MDRRQAMLSVATLPLLMNKTEPTKDERFGTLIESPEITIHFVCPYHGRQPDPVWDDRAIASVPLGHYGIDSFIKWRRNGCPSDKTLVILEGTYTAEEMAEQLSMQCCPVHDCIKFVVQNGRCVPIPT